MLGDIVGHLLIKAGEKLLELLGRGVGRLDLWFERRFGRWVLSEMAFYEKVVKVKADVAAYLINCFPFHLSISITLRW